MTDKAENAKEALNKAKASLQTARISLDELAKLRAETRGPLPTMRQLAALIGKDIDDDDVLIYTSTLGLRKRALPAGGYDAAGRNAGIRFALDVDKRITSVALYGEGEIDKSFTPWHGQLKDSINMTSTAADVKKALGRPAAVVMHDGYEEERYLEDGVVYAFVYVDSAIGLVRVRKGTT